MKEITGHRTPNGGYITKAEAIKHHNEFEKECENNRKQKELEEQKQEQLTALAIHEEFQNQQKYIEQQKIHCQQCKQFVSFAAENTKNYNEYLIAWDIANNDCYSIENALYRNKVTKEQIKTIYNKALNFIDDLKNSFPISILINDLQAN
jgi:signal recognition particle GTPase